MAKKQQAKAVNVPTGIKVAAGFGVVLAIAGHAGAGHAKASPVLDTIAAAPSPLPASAPARAGAADAKAIAFARAQEGKPYLWGGRGPDSFDCSGLTLRAWEDAGVTLAPTSQTQWRTGHRVASPEPGDLVYFAGADGTRSAPGHVGLVVGPNQMIDAYAAGTRVRQESFGVPGSAEGIGPGQVVGYTDPDPAARRAPIPPRPAPAPAVTAAHYTPTAFAVWFLHAARLPAGKQNICTVVWWQRKEDTYLKFNNPLDSTQREPGARSVNHVGVKQYTSIAQGVAADAATLHEHWYPNIVADFARSAPAARTETDIDHSPWGTHGSPDPC